VGLWLDLIDALSRGAVVATAGGPVRIPGPELRAGLAWPY
jgi:hypothetical protein